MNHCVLWRQLIALFLITHFFCVNAQTVTVQSTQSVVALKNGIVQSEAVSGLFSDLVRVKNITFESDCFVQKEEFFYILGFASGDEIYTASISNALEFFAKKNKFSEIKINSTLDAEGVDIHFFMKGIWTFNKVKIRGVFQGKNRFSHCYLLSKGDPFDLSKHKHSLAKIKESLIRAGFHNSRITTTYNYDNITQEVTVFITITRGKCFRFEAVTVELSSEELESDSDRLQKELQQRLAHNLHGQKSTKELLSREAILLKEYLAKKGFLHVTLELKEKIDNPLAKVDVTWKIFLHQKRHIVFFGNRFFSKRELFEKIVAFGRSAWLLPASLLAEEILNTYKNKGFWQAEITAQEEKERSFFIIKEGNRAIITAVEIHNAQHINQLILKKHCFNKLLKHKYYDVSIYDEAINSLINFYQRESFLSCVVVDHSFAPCNNENEYTLIITIDEGNKSYIESVTIEGYPQLQSQGPFKKYRPLNVNTSDKILFDTALIDEQRNWLTHYFQQLGYLHPRIKAQVETKGQDMFINWIVQTGEKIRFGKTVISGSSRFPYSFISRLICYNQGDLWNQEKIKQTFKFLKDLEIFETINLVPDYAYKSEEKPIILKLQLDDPYEVRVRAGLELQHVQKYQTFSGLAYKIGGTALMKNPFNAADQIRLDLDFARSHREVVGRYRRPLFFRTPLLSTMQVYSISYNQPGFVGSANDIYTVIQNGFFFGLERKTKLFDLGCNTGCEWMKTKIKNKYLQENLARAINFKPQLIDKMVPFFFIGPTCMTECLDNALNPTRGFLTLMSLKGMVPLEKKYKDSFFVKLLFEQSCFIPLKSVVAAIRFRFGHIFYRQLSAIMPSERFYLGGSHSLRGYEADLAPPLGIFSDDDADDHIVPRGGKSMLNGNLELRFPIVKKIGCVLFQDFGALSGDNFADFKPHNILAATGFGARFFTPLGPLRFDIGWKWKRQQLVERAYAWFLTFGQAF